MDCYTDTSACANDIDDVKFLLAIKQKMTDFGWTGKLMYAFGHSNGAALS